MPQWGWPFCIFTGLFTALVVAPQASGDDWSSLWIGGILAGRGQWDDAYSIHPTDFSLTGSALWDQLRVAETTSNVAHPFVHNPGIAIFMSLVTSVTTFKVSLYLLSFLSGACVPLMVALSYRFWVEKTIDLYFLVPLSLVLWASEAMRSALDLGQTSPLIFTACLAALALARRRPVLAACLLAVAAFVKLTPLLVIAGFLLAPSYRRTGAYAAVASFGLFGASFLALWGANTEWFRTLSAFSSKQLVSTMNCSLGSLLHAPKKGEAVVSAVDTLPGYNVLVAAVVVIMIGVFAWTCARLERIPEKPLVVLSLLGPMLVAKILWTHYTLALVLPIVGILVAGLVMGERLHVLFSIFGGFVLLAPHHFSFADMYNASAIANYVLWFFTVLIVAASTKLAQVGKIAVPGVSPCKVSSET